MRMVSGNSPNRSNRRDNSTGAVELFAFVVDVFDVYEPTAVNCFGPPSVDEPRLMIGKRV